MSATAPRYSSEEFARRGHEVYDRIVRPNVGCEDDGKLVAIDIETHEYEIDQDGYAASEKLLTRRPDAQLWLMRVGQPTAYRLGGRALRKS